MAHTKSAQVDMYLTEEKKTHKNNATLEFGSTIPQIPDRIFLHPQAVH
jgi:hypothetical protein